MTEKYELVREIGHGSRAKVYLVRNNNTDEMLAMKSYPYVGQEGQRELQVLKEIKSQGIPFLFDCIKKDGSMNIFMEYIPGKNLRQILQTKHVFTEKEVLSIGKKVLHIIQLFHAHSPQWIYGDLKPENIMITEKGEVYLIDFGSVMIDGEKHMDVHGTKAYYCETAGAMLPFRDTYALGLIMYEMLTGCSYQQGIQNGKADVCHLSEVCQDIMKKAVRLNPKEGYKDAMHMLQEFDLWENNMTEGRVSYRRKKGNDVIGDTCRFIMHGFLKPASQGMLILLVIAGLLFMKFEGYRHFVKEAQQYEEKIETVTVYNKQIGNHYRLDVDSVRAVQEEQNAEDMVEKDSYGRSIMRRK
ncbi:MAG: protein kinase [Lachnospiraceae bacterium]|nr:protein kinase [Lachnospiraceae bacterium]